ncbi:MAG: hypothetical protein AB1486_17045 [Planctomycetota bacterium]
MTRNCISRYLIAVSLLFGCGDSQHCRDGEEERVVSKEEITDPMQQAQDLRAYFRKCPFFQAYRNGYLYNTVGNCSPATPEKERGLAWELVYVFEGEERRVVNAPSAKPNWTVFRRPAPAFYTAPNPWQTKGTLAWLPDLDAEVPPSLIPHLEASGGHGSPCVARRYRCPCGENAVRILSSEDKGRVVAACAKCNRKQILLDQDTVTLMHEKPGDPVPVSDDLLSAHRCECGEALLIPLLAIEYSVDSEEGWDFTWLNILSLCPKCDRSKFIWEFEAQ